MKRVKPYSKSNRNYPYTLIGSPAEKKRERIRLITILISNDTYIKPNGKPNIAAMMQKLGVSRQAVKADIKTLHTAFDNEYIKEDGKPNISKAAEALQLPPATVKRYVEAVIYNQRSSTR